jgi:hypothetical protein
VLTVPGVAPIKLRMEEYLARAAAGAEDSTAPVKEVDCPECKGCGHCSTCRGRGVLMTQGYLRTVGQILFFVLFGVWGFVFRHLIENPASGHSSLGSDGCTKCLGRGHCYRCRGAGKLLVRL